MIFIMGIRVVIVVIFFMIICVVVAVIVFMTVTVIMIATRIAIFEMYVRLIRHNFDHKRITR